MVGGTGALLPWQEALTLGARPALSRAAPPSPGAHPLDAVTLAERVEGATGGQIPYLNLVVPTDHVAIVPIGARTGQADLGYDTLWVDPYSGAIRLRYRSGVLADGAQNIMPFLYQLHMNLAVGDWGSRALGIAALIWTIDCFVGFYLTLPISRPTPARWPVHKTWWQRWLPAWRVRKHAQGHKFNFDLHRAGGLWLWPVLLVFAWSSVGFNLSSVHGPVMKALGSEPYFEGTPLSAPVDKPAIDRRTALSVAKSLMISALAERHAEFQRAGLLFYDAATGLYSYRARTSLDWSRKDASTTIWFSGVDGKLRHFEPPLGGTGADQTMAWFYMLHMARVFGLPYRIFVSILGLAIAALSVTGVLIWTKKRSARLIGNRRASRSPRS